MESCLAVALVGLAVFAAASTFGGRISDQILNGIVPGLGGPQSLEMADAGSVGGGGGGDSDTGDTGSVGGGAGSPPDGEPDTGSVGGGSAANPPDAEPDTGGVGGGVADGGNPGSEE